MCLRRGVWLVVVFFFLAAFAGVSALCLRGRSRAGHAPAASDLHGTSMWEIVDVHVRRAAQTCFVVAAAFEPVIVVLYWSMLYTNGTDSTPNQYMRDVTNHAVTFICLAVDLALGSMRLPDRQCLVAFVAGVVYLFINLGYTKTAGTPVYSVLTWADGSSAILALGALAGMCVFYFLASALAWGLDSCAAMQCCRCAAREGSKSEAAAFARALHAPPPDVAAAVGKDAPVALAFVPPGPAPNGAASPPSPPSGCGATRASACPGVGIAAVYTEAARVARDPFPTGGFVDEARAFPCHSCPCTACRRDEE